MSDPRAGTGRPSPWTFALLGLLAVFAVVAIRFAIRQSVWTDESTQLSGLSLRFADQLRWLAGKLPEAFAVPPDRTPPLSYWLGTLWAAVFGSGALTARYLSVSLSGASIVVLWAITRKYYGPRIALAGAAFLALSPNFLVEAAEIRAYAAFILFATILVYAYLRLVAAKPNPSSADLWLFAVSTVLCSYTHFFGIVISAGAFLAAVLCYLPVGSASTASGIARKAKWPLLLCVAGMIALVPLILSALRISPGADPQIATPALQPGIRSHEFIKLVYRLFSHQSMLGIPKLPAATMLAGLALLALSAAPGSSPRCRPLQVFLLVNLGLVIAVGLTTHAFSAFAPSYNVWALPVTALLAAGAFDNDNRVVRLVCSVCAAILISGDCYASWKLATAGELYAHTRSSIVSSSVDAAGPGKTVVIYVNDAPSIYFALIYEYGDNLRQYLDAGGELRRIGPAAGSPPAGLCSVSADTLLLVRDQQLSADELQFQIDHPGQHSEALRALDEFIHAHRSELDARWTLSSMDEYLSQSALALAVLRARRGDSPAAVSDCKATTARSDIAPAAT